MSAAAAAAPPAFQISYPKRRQILVGDAFAAFGLTPGSPANIVGFLRHRTRPKYDRLGALEPTTGNFWAVFFKDVRRGSGYVLEIWDKDKGVCLGVVKGLRVKGGGPPHQIKLGVGRINYPLSNDQHVPLNFWAWGQTQDTTVVTVTMSNGPTSVPQVASYQPTNQSLYFGTQFTMNVNDPSPGWTCSASQPSGAMTPSTNLTLTYH